MIIDDWNIIITDITNAHILGPHAVTPPQLNGKTSN